MDRCVMVVEDDEQAAKLFALFLTAEGYRVVRVATGEEALMLVGQLRPTAVLLDVILPGMDGWEVLSELKSSPLTRDIPVVIVSVLDRQTLGFRLGAVEHLVKPVERVQLVRAVERSIAPSAVRGRLPTVVMVHRSDDAFVTLRGLFDRAGYRLFATAEGSEALPLAKRLHPDLMVFEMVARGCVEAIHALRTEPDTSDIPVLVLTTGGLSPEQEADLSGRIQTVLISETREEEALVGVVNRYFSTEERHLIR